MNDIITLVANDIVFLGIPKHWHRGTSSIPSFPQSINFLQSSTLISVIRTRDKDILIRSWNIVVELEFPRAVSARGGNGDGNGVFEALEGPDDEGAVGPGAGEAHVEVKMRIVRGWAWAAGDFVGPESGGGPGVTTGGVGGGELGHHEAPRGVPGGADGGDEEIRREGWAPQELRD